MLHGGLAVMYGYALYDANLDRQENLQKWFRLPEHEALNNFLCWTCHMGYGLGYFVLVFRQWIMSVHLDNIMGPGI